MKKLMVMFSLLMLSCLVMNHTMAATAADNTQNYDVLQGQIMKQQQQTQGQIKQLQTNLQQEIDTMNSQLQAKIKTVQDQFQQQMQQLQAQINKLGQTQTSKH